MYSRLQLLTKYISYYVSAANGRGHGIHSPFVFDFVKYVLNDRSVYPAYGVVEALRRKLLRDGEVIEVVDLGAGSSLSATRMRSIREIARHAAKSRKYAQLIYRIVHHYKPLNTVELGTSLGITTAYLAAATDPSQVFSIEGAPLISERAKQHLGGLYGKDINLFTGNFDVVLPGVLQQMKAVGLAFVDGNHRQEPTLRYFELLLPYLNADSIIIFDDIHWSPEMEAAWETIKSHPAVTLTIDLFFIGLVFFRTDFKTRQHFVIRF